MSGNTQELLSQGVQVGLKRREPYHLILEASIGYAGAAAVAVLDKVVYVNERQDRRMEGIEEGALSLVPRVMSVEEENHQLREVQWAQEERIARDGERIWDLERSVGTLRTLINSLVETVGLVQNCQGHSTLSCQCVFEGAQLTQLVQLVTAGRLFLGHKGQVDL